MNLKKKKQEKRKQNIAIKLSNNKIAFQKEFVKMIDFNTNIIHLKNLKKLKK